MTLPSICNQFVFSVMFSKSGIRKEDEKTLREFAHHTMLMINSENIKLALIASCIITVVSMPLSVQKGE